MFDSRDPKNDVEARAKIVLCAMLSATLILFICLYRLQISDAGKYALLSDQNRIRVSPILPKRGRIITADGKTVAGNACTDRLRIAPPRKNLPKTCGF